MVENRRSVSAREEQKLEIRRGQRLGPCALQASSLRPTDLLKTLLEEQKTCQNHGAPRGRSLPDLARSHRCAAWFLHAAFVGHSRTFELRSILVVYPLAIQAVLLANLIVSLPGKAFVWPQNRCVIFKAEFKQCKVCFVYACLSPWGWVQ